MAPEEWVSTRKFMVVEDVDSSRILVAGLLRGLGATEVVGATDGEDALRRMEAGFVPDVVFCDWEMPKMDGLSLLTVVKKLYPATKVVMLTARTGRDDVLSAGYFHADGYIGKPFTRKVLLATLEKLQGSV